jgi:hypothetical protein
VIWIGKYLEDGVIPPPMIQVVNEMIERTSRITGRLSVGRRNRVSFDVGLHRLRLSLDAA